MGKYCCFFCPSEDYGEKSLSDTCPQCGRNYGFVLDYEPEKIREFRITQCLSRGFYGATYIAERGRFRTRVVIKISPVDFYRFFNKPSFEEETDRHFQIAESAEHIIGIEDSFTELVEFTDKNHTKLNCYVSVLEYVDGKLLRDYLYGNCPMSAAAVCQIAIDLLMIRSEFEANMVNHNDLHAENLMVQKLPNTARRLDALDESIKVKAIDLGSISDASKSTDNRDGDLTFIAKHVDLLLNRLLSNPENIEDREYRIALALQTIVVGLQGNAPNIRRPDFDTLIEMIRDAYYRASYAWRPWTKPLTLRAFGDHYNAQTLESWHVPSLLVDPNNEWVSTVKKNGPQIITGMRGCGKTMLLRALDIHARASRLQDETPEEVLEKIKLDGYVGLFVSAQRLLDLREHSLLRLEHRLTRLFTSYSLQAARALLHLKDLKADSIRIGSHKILGNAIADCLSGAEELRDVISLEDLECRLEKIVVLTSRGEQKYLVLQTAADAFPHIATKFRSCSSVFEDSLVFFLLDDVSTRYLELDKIEALLSSTLFQNPHCAFKFTSEWQTVELGLQSPGRNHPISDGRDLDIFDLGAHVFETIKASGKNKGKDFVNQILKQRTRFHASSPTNIDPKVVLGDITLEKVAKEIAKAGKTSAKLKNVYRGLSCLTNVCVGDIGDIIKLYEMILRKIPSSGELPIPQKEQSECFQNLSSRRIYDLNRRNSYFKNHSLAFSEAAHELLARSAKSQGASNPRLRQYSSVYVRVTTEDSDSSKQQIDKLRDLIDAGVFVYTGGNARTKTKDSNPTRQFKLSYRKIYGLASFIGLADRDRFELSGKDLETWLSNPATAKEILIRNQVIDPEKIDEQAAADDDDINLNDESDEVEKEVQLFSEPMNLFEITELEGKTKQTMQAKPIDVNIDCLASTDLANIEISSVLSALGFEDRSLASNQFLAQIINPSKVHLIKYPFDGKAQLIREEWSRKGSQIEEHSYNSSLISAPELDGLSLIDVSGLSKPLIFRAIRQELIKKGRVLVCHASAKNYYPLPEDLEQIFAAEKSQEPRLLLESLANVLKGESGEYADLSLLQEEVDPSRIRALIACSSAKHERLFSLLDKRDYDYIQVLTPKGEEPWKKVAQLAAEFLCQNYNNANISVVDINDLAGLVKYLDDQFLRLYSKGGANLEIGLTGSKAQAIAAAILSARRKVSQAWYLNPKQFDANRFSSGLGEIRLYDIKVKE